MKSSFLPIVLTVAGGVIYHVSQKAVPKTVSPFAAIILAYTIGIILCAICLYFDSSHETFLGSVKNANWAVIALGVGAVIIELGFLLAYRAAWNISSASVISNISVALLLLPIGLIAFKEHLSWQSGAGIVCCLVGLYLLSGK